MGEETTCFPDFLATDGLGWEVLARVEPANEFLRVGNSWLCSFVYVMVNFSGF